VIVKDEKGSSWSRNWGFLSRNEAETRALAYCGWMSLRADQVTKAGKEEWTGSSRR